MPGFNGTGPEGNGSNTGRGRGRCIAATEQQQGLGQGFGSRPSTNRVPFPITTPCRVARQEGGEVDV